MSFDFAKRIKSLKGYKGDLPLTVVLDENGDVVAYQANKIDMKENKKAIKAGKVPKRLRDKIGKNYMDSDEMVTKLGNVAKENLEISQYHEKKAEYHKKEAGRYQENAQRCYEATDEAMRQIALLSKEGDKIKKTKQEDMLKSQENVTPDQTELFQKK